MSRALIVDPEAASDRLMPSERCEFVGQQWCQIDFLTAGARAFQSVRGMDAALKLSWTNLQRLWNALAPQSENQSDTFLVWYPRKPVQS